MKNSKFFEHNEVKIIETLTAPAQLKTSYDCLEAHIFSLRLSSMTFAEI